MATSPQQIQLNNERRKRTFSLQKSFEDIPTRYVLAFWSFWGFFNAYTLRGNLSVAMAAMVNYTSLQNPDLISDDCPSRTPNVTNNMSQKEGEFFWDGDLQGTILSSFFYGYVVTQIPGGMLAEKFGGKLLFGFGILCTSLLSLLTPIVAQTSVHLLIALRIIQGLGEGVTFPAMHSMWSKWAPTTERTKLTALSYGGILMGSIVCMPLSGLLAKFGFAGGWPSIFYVFGTLGCIWFIGWMIFVHDIPSAHPRISIDECKYIENSIGEKTATLQRLPIPWLSILKSLPVWAISVSMFGTSWTLYLLLTNLPIYFNVVLKFPIEENGYLSSLPYLCAWLVAIFVSVLSDRLRRISWINQTILQKLFGVTAHLTNAGFLTLITIAGCNSSVIIVLFCLAAGFGAFVSASTTISSLDLAPRIAGTLYGITNTLGNSAGIISPQIAGSLTGGKPHISDWNVVFLIGASINLFSGLFYGVFASADLQPWADVHNAEEIKTLTSSNSISAPEVIQNF